MYDEYPPCVACGTAVRGTADVPMCRLCRTTTTAEQKAALGMMVGRRKMPVYFHTCEQCERTFTSRTGGVRFCSPQCVGDSQRVRPDDDRRVQRWKRDQRAPGLSTHQRGRLLAKWKRQGRQCSYCPDIADTIDHLLPLVRGGSNHEGNLVPACRRCNSSKASRTVMEWRLGQSVPRTVSGALSLLPERDTRQALRLVQVRACRWCTRTIQSKRLAYCSDKCRDASARARSGALERVKLTPEQSRERKKAAKKAWMQTPAGRAAKKRARDRWKKTPSGRASSARSEARREQRRRVSTDQMTLAG